MGGVEDGRVENVVDEYTDSIAGLCEGYGLFGEWEGVEFQLEFVCCEFGFLVRSGDEG